VSTPLFVGTSQRSAGTGHGIYSVAVNAALSGVNTIVAAQAGYVILVTAYKIVCANDVTVTWESGGGRVLDGPCAFSINSGESTPFDPDGHFWTDAGEALILRLGGAVQVGGHVKYALVPR